jgi:putative transport protein
MVDWFFATLKQYPEIAIFLTLGIGYYFGKFTFKGIGLGSVTATLLAGVLIGQIGITIAQPLKATVFLMFLFAVGYGVGPQFVRGVATTGVPQALFTVVQCLFSLLVPVAIAKFAGYDLGYAAGLYSGSQTISAAMGLSTDAINRLGLAADQSKALIDSMPVAYAVSYMFGTMGSAVVIAVLGPKLLGINLVAACKDYEEKHGGGGKEIGGPGTAWRRWEVRAFRVAKGGRAVGLRASEAEALLPDARVFVLRVRRNGQIEEAGADTVLQEGDVVAVAGARDALFTLLGEGAAEVEDRELLAVPVEGVDVLVSNKAVDGKTLAELAEMPGARGVFLRKITRGATATSIPILANTTVQRGDLLTITGRTRDTDLAIKLLGVADRATDITDMAFVGMAIVAHVRTRPDAHHLVHELGRPQHLHRHRRHLRRSGFRERTEDSGCGAVPVGCRRDHHSAGARDVRCQVSVPLPRRADARHHLRGTHDDGVPRAGVRSGQEPGAGARLHRDLCRRQHPADNLGHGPDHPALVERPARTR